MTVVHNARLARGACATRIRARRSKRSRWACAIRWRAARCAGPAGVRRCAAAIDVHGDPGRRDRAGRVWRHHTGEADSASPSRAERGRGAAAAAARDARRRTRADHYDVHGRCARAGASPIVCTSPATSPTTDLPDYLRPPISAPACAGRPTARPRRRGCAALPPGGRRSSPISRTLVDVPTLDPRGWRVLDTAPARRRSRSPSASTCSTKIIRCSSRSSGSRPTRRCASGSGAPARAWWEAHHQLEPMADAYDRGSAAASRHRAAARHAARAPLDETHGTREALADSARRRRSARRRFRDSRRCWPTRALLACAPRRLRSLALSLLMFALHARSSCGRISGPRAPASRCRATSCFAEPRRAALVPRIRPPDLTRSPTVRLLVTPRACRRARRPALGHRPPGTTRSADRLPDVGRGACACGATRIVAGRPRRAWQLTSIDAGQQPLHVAAGSRCGRVDARDARRVAAAARRRACADGGLPRRRADPRRARQPRHDRDADDAGADRRRPSPTADRCSARSSRVPIVGGLLLLSSAGSPRRCRFRSSALRCCTSRRARRSSTGIAGSTGALCALPAPMLVISLTAAAFLLGVDAALRRWRGSATQRLDLRRVVCGRPRRQRAHRRRGHPALSHQSRCQRAPPHPDRRVHGRAGGVRVCDQSRRAAGSRRSPDGRSSCRGSSKRLLQAIVLLPALALPYAVAVKHVFSPRTVLRRSLQYALARRTLSVLIAAADRGAGDLAHQPARSAARRHHPGAAAVLRGQPSALAALGLRYRDQAQRWLDRRFFRAEYDAREILVVARQPRAARDRSAHSWCRWSSRRSTRRCIPNRSRCSPATTSGSRWSRRSRTDVEPLPRDGGLATLLRWSDEPLEVFLDDERSPAARLPAADRAWLAAPARVVAAGADLRRAADDGDGSARRLDRARAETIGRTVHAGRSPAAQRHRRADERRARPVAAADAASIGTARRRRGDADADADDGRRTTDRASTALAMCPTCRRCFDCSTLATSEPAPRCPDDGDVAAAGDRHAAGRRRQVSRRRGRRPRRHGRGVPRARSAARSRRRDQDRARRSRRRSRVARAVPARGADRRPAAASGDRDGLRLRQPARRRRVSGDGVRARRGPAQSAEAREDARRRRARSSS